MKQSDEFQARVIPFKKINFWDIERLNFSRQKWFFFYLEHYSTLFLVIFLPKTKKKMTFFDQKHGFIPLKKCNFWDFERLNFVWPKKVSFLSGTLLNIFSSLILTENK